MAGVPVGDTTLLQRLKELDEKATPGPWETQYIEGAPGRLIVTSPHLWNVWDGGENCDLIAELRNALPAVVTLIEAARPFADPFHANTAEELRALRAALAPFVGEATQ